MAAVDATVTAMLKTT